MPDRDLRRTGKLGLGFTRWRLQQLDQLATRTERMFGAVHDPAEDAMYLATFHSATRQVPATNQPDHERLHALILISALRA